MTPPYVPRRVDIVWLHCGPQAGREQAGRRPALVLSPEAYNRKVHLMLCCPITNQETNYAFEVRLSGTHTSGVVLADQIRSLDWVHRQAEYKETTPRGILNDVIAKAMTLLVTAA